MSYNENPSYGLKNPSGSMVLIQSQTASNSASLKFTTGIAGYDLYYLAFYNVTVDTATEVLSLQLSTDGGGTWITTGYTTNGLVTDSSGATSQYNNTNAGMMLAFYTETSTTAPINGYCTIYGLGSSTYQKSNILFNNQQLHTLGSVATNVSTVCSSTSVINALQVISETSGNILTGTFKLYGIVN